MKFDDQGIHIHQSDLKNHCLEKLRLETVATGPRIENDAATVGTALHAVIETELGGAVYDDLDACAAQAVQEYLRLLETYQAEDRPYALSSFGNHDKAISLLVKLAHAWFYSDERDMLLSAGDYLVEWKFDLPFTVVPVKKHGKKADEVPVFLSGTADLVFNNRVWDWKTAGSEYRRWELQRWGRQPDVYTWAATEAGLITPSQSGVTEFWFKVFVRGAEPTNGCQTVEIQRTANNWRWLEQIVHRLVNFSYNMGLDREWPLDDQHVLCSPKWCTFFNNGCKGGFVDGETWT